MATQNESTSNGTPELCLRFSCSNCQQVLLLPLQPKMPIEDKCPACRQMAYVPRVDPHVRGVDVVWRCQAPTMGVSCPACHQRLKVAPDFPGKQRHCPRCNRSLVMQLVVDRKTDSQPTPSANPGESVPPNATTGPREPFETVSPPTKPRPLPPAARPPGLPNPSEPEKENTPASEPLVYREVEPSPPHRPWLLVSPRDIGWVVWLILQIGIPLTLHLIAKATNDMFFNVVAIAFLIPRLNLASRISNFIVPFLVSKFRCPGCQDDIECVNRWKCGCGYVDHRERHVLRFRCPKCSGLIGHTNCPRCDSTIFLR